MKDVQIVYRPGRENDRADALSRNPVTTPATNHLEVGAQVAQVTDSRGDITPLLLEEPGVEVEGVNFQHEQRKDVELNSLISYVESGDVPTDLKELQKVATQALHFAVVDGLLYFVDDKAGNPKESCCAVTLEGEDS